MLLHCARISLASLLLCSGLIATPITTASAAPAATQANANIYGFISQGLVYTTDNHFFGHSEDISLRFHDLAIGANWRPWSILQFAGQAMYRQAGQTARDDIFVDYLVADLALYESMTTQLGIRAGRLKNMYGFFNDTRDIPSSRPSILLPESIYVDRFRDVLHSSDSASLYGSTYVGNLLLQLDVLQGRPIISPQASDEITVPGLSGENKGESVTNARLLVEAMGGSLRLAYSYAEADASYRPDPGRREISVGPGVFLNVPVNGYAGTAEFGIDAWSLEYSIGNWQFTAERSEFTFKRKDILAPGLTLSSETLSYYYSASYQLNTRWSAFARIDTFFANPDDRDGRDAAATTGRPRHNFFAYDRTLGLRYEHDNHWSLAAEYHHVRGTGWLSTNENDMYDSVEKWGMLVAQLNYKF